MIGILEGVVYINNVEEFLSKIKKIGEERNMVIQVMDADKLAGEKHIRFAVEKAIHSFKTGRNIANQLSKEIMLYAAGTRQINKAMKLGIHEGKNNIAIVTVGEQPDLSGIKITPKPVLEYHESKKEVLMEIFNITEKEIKAVGEDKIPELVLERVALLDVIK